MLEQYTQFKHCLQRHPYRLALVESIVLLLVMAWACTTFWHWLIAISVQWLTTLLTAIGTAEEKTNGP